MCQPRWIILLATCGLMMFSSAGRSAESRDLPIVPKGFAVDVVATEPFVRNPCVMAFDQRGRIFVGQGPQWRGPTPQTEGDRVDILIDRDGDGTTDQVKTFAKGFNSIQGLAWRGKDLWIANAPDLTIVRDLDGDDEADEYVRVYTGLGNLEHSLHGLNFGPDGKLYMSKGNSKGYNRLDQLAPKAFRELWDLPSPPGAPDYTPIEVFKKGAYKRKYHTPADDWGRQGGILRCDPDGRNLEIVARGFRNPWDIAFDDAFNWLGTDNDQTQGDKVFSPFFGAHFGWGHAWSYHWTGKGHLPTVPASAPLFEGSGAGVIHYHATHFPEPYRDVFFVNDWLRREVYLFRPKWDGALMTSDGGRLSVFAHAGGGRAMSSSSGRLFDPTDIEVGPDGALYILSWGASYGATIKNGQHVDKGRLFRIHHVGRPLLKTNLASRAAPLTKRSNKELLTDLAHHVPAWRIDAQDELIRRYRQGDTSVRTTLIKQLTAGNPAKAQRTWFAWTLGRLALEDRAIDQHFEKVLKASNENPTDVTIQGLRILAYRVRHATKPKSLPAVVREMLASNQPRVRHEAVQAIWQARNVDALDALIEVAAKEKDRVTFFSTWHAIRELADAKRRRQWLTDPRAGVRLAALLGLLEDGHLKASEVIPLQSDSDPRVAGIADSWLEKTGASKPLLVMSPPPGEFHGATNVTLSTTVPGAQIRFTTNGNPPEETASLYTGPIRVTSDTTIKASVIKGRLRIGRVFEGRFQVKPSNGVAATPFVSQLRAKSGRDYRVDWTGLTAGKQHYTDRTYTVTRVPAELEGLPFIRTANNDDRTLGDNWLTFNTSDEVTVYLAMDARIDRMPAWMNVDKPGGFRKTDLKVVTTDPTFVVFRKKFPAGRVVLGANMNHTGESRRGNYIVVLERKLLKPQTTLTTVEAALGNMTTADVARGRELFLHGRGAGCYRCHRMENRGNTFAPDLSDLGSRGSAEAIVRSILHPSEVITEGFSQQIIGTESGDVHAGVVLEESAIEVKLALVSGKTVAIPKKDILERRTTKLSVMPGDFGKTMSPQQIADITAWLMSQKITGDRDGFSFRNAPNQLDIHFAGKRIATYLKKHDQLTRRSLVNVNTLTGIQVTRNFPPRLPEDRTVGYNREHGIDHPVMHPGIWIGFGDVHGNDYWRLQSKVIFDGFVHLPTGDKTSGSFTTRNRYMNRDGKQVVCTQITRYVFRRVKQGWLVNINAAFSSKDRDFYFGDQEESGLAVRVASPIRVQGGNGTILNDRGEKNGAQVWGKQAKWVDYAGVIDSRRVGVMVMPSPVNPRPSWLHARDYGVVVVNPFPKQPKERREPYVKTYVKKGERFTLSYGVLVHDTPADQSFNHRAVYNEFIESLQTRGTTSEDR